MDYVRENLDWLHERLQPFIKGGLPHNSRGVPIAKHGQMVQSASAEV